MWYTLINHNLFPTRRGNMTEKHEIRAKSMELALAFMGLIFDVPMIDTANEDEVKEFNDAFKYAEYFSRRFEDFILKETPALPKQ
jgi:hypothetical protein